MSEDAPVSRKEKKAQRDAERHKGGKKRKREDDGPKAETAVQHELHNDFIPLSSDRVAEAAVEEKLRAQSQADPTRRRDIKSLKSFNRKKSNDKKEKKRKAQAEIEDALAVIDEDGTDIQPPEAKKRRKTKSSTEQTGEQQEDGQTTSTTKPRFILFIGNLPYSTTDASLQNYFKSIAPFTLRHRTDPKTNKSKGFAFLEFENFDRMKTCMKLYHHSIFDPTQHLGDSVEKVKDEKSKKGKDQGRRINVELTAGGGGSKEGRMEKIKAKNVRLNEQRQRRAEAERKEKEKEKLKEEKVKEEDGGGRREKKKKKKGQHGATKAVLEPKLESPAVKAEDNSQMHPSRLARMNG